MFERAMKSLVLGVLKICIKIIAAFQAIGVSRYLFNGTKKVFPLHFSYAKILPVTLILLNDSEVTTWFILSL